MLIQRRLLAIGAAVQEEDATQRNWEQICALTVEGNKGLEGYSKNVLRWISNLIVLHLSNVFCIVTLTGSFVWKLLFFFFWSCIFRETVTMQFFFFAFQRIPSLLGRDSNGR